MDLRTIIREEIVWYAGSGRGGNLRLFPLLDDEHGTYAVVSIDYPNPTGSGLVVMARIYGEQIIIEDDNTDRPLYKSLLQRGIPRSQIVLAYAGEPIPDAAHFSIEP